jgi:ABC-type sugar transport system ATPase subunit
MSDRVLVLWDGGIVGEFKRGEAELGMVMSLMTGSASLRGASA